MDDRERGNRSDSAWADLRVRVPCRVAEMPYSTKVPTTVPAPFEPLTRTEAVPMMRVGYRERRPVEVVYTGAFDEGMIDSIPVLRTG